jgi:hypothetical protein
MATTKPKKKRALDIGKVLSAVDMHNYDLYSNLTPEELKEFSAYVLMRYVSNTSSRDRDIQEWYVTEVNERVNLNHWLLSKKHDGLLWKLYATLGVGQKQDHQYLSALKPSLNKIEKLIAELNPAMKIDEIKLTASLMDDNDCKDLLDKMGFDKKERKVYE